MTLDRELLQHEKLLKNNPGLAQFAIRDRSMELEAKYKAVAWRCATFSVVVLCLTITCVALEAYAALSLQFCHEEDLMMFYWGTWSIFQIGCAIAHAGLVQFQLHNCLSPKHPHCPWNVALGTPIPVICGAFYYLEGISSGLYHKVSSSNHDEKS